MMRGDRLEAAMRDAQACLRCSFRDHFEGHQRIAGIAFVAPGVGEFFVGNGIYYPAQVQKLLLVVAAGEAEFEARLGAESWYIEIPLAHLFGIGECRPDAGGSGVVYA